MKGRTRERKLTNDLSRLPQGSIDKKNVHADAFFPLFPLSIIFGISCEDEPI